MGEIELMEIAIKILKSNEYIGEGAMERFTKDFRETYNLSDKKARYIITKAMWYSQ